MYIFLSGSPLRSVFVISESHRSTGNENGARDLELEAFDFRSYEAFWRSATELFLQGSKQDVFNCFMIDNDKLETSFVRYRTYIFSAV